MDGGVNTASLGCTRSLELERAKVGMRLVVICGEKKVTESFGNKALSALLIGTREGSNNSLENFTVGIRLRCLKISFLIS